MNATLLFSIAAAVFIVVITPGPAVLAVLSLGAAQGRWAAAQFLFGHIAGDMLWSLLALVALVGANLVSPWLFHALALFCGVYLFWIGTRAMLARRSATGGPVMVVKRPYVRGLMFGISNPKGYPVTLAVFTSLLAGRLEAITVENLPLFLAACMVGSVVGDLVLVWIIGMGPLRRFYARHEVWFLRVTGLMFVGFAINTLAHLWWDLRAPAR
jgi:threonine/homoserine/homoserine lactone efflux protein